MRVAALLLVFPLLGACKMNSGEASPAEVRSEPKAAAAQPVAPAATTVAEPQTAAAPAGPVKLGEPVTEKVVALSAITKEPGAFKGKTIATTGKVAAVCQEKGCWMELVDADGHANVRMHGHAFFVPRTSSGRTAKVQGTVVLKKDGKECDEMESTGAKVELDATGVELM